MRKLIIIVVIVGVLGLIGKFWFDNQLVNHDLPTGVEVQQTTTVDKTTHVENEIIVTKVGEIPIKSITYVQIVNSEMGPYVIIHADLSKTRHIMQTMSKDDYLKIRDIILSYHIAEIVS